MDRTTYDKGFTKRMMVRTSDFAGDGSRREEVTRRLLHLRSANSMVVGAHRVNVCYGSRYEEVNVPSLGTWEVSESHLYITPGRIFQI
jgi:hypothetical protein